MQEIPSLLLWASFKCVYPAWSPLRRLFAKRCRYR